MSGAIGNEGGGEEKGHQQQQERRKSNQNDDDREENQSIEQLRAELDNVKFQLHQARQVIEKKERQVTGQEEGIGKLNMDKSKIEKRNAELEATVET
ncbi:hypothetical protein CAEBREN_24698 [Caenorhabditis brenneri]|uniref:Uncharacterized protein n=1 Tax=Caenorhabditis brenneri TaxID=135651 RepID=G0NP83_CAEBE|nr:hypothetical protein CAEBREN_24698 [Caenorhabditis brenneri]